MRIPNKIIILGRTFNIIRTVKPLRWCTNADRGAFHVDKEEIWLSTAYSKNSQSSALFHEVHEIICDIFEVRYYSYIKGLDTNLELPLFIMDHNKYRDIMIVFWSVLKENKLFND
jgi:hypothetical protein